MPVQLVSQQFEMHHDGVDGVLDLVADSGGKPADGRHSAREFQLAFDFAHRFQIVQRKQGAQALPLPVGVFIVDEIERNLHSTAGFGRDLFLHHGNPGVEGISHRPAQQRVPVEHLVNFSSQDVIAVHAEEPFDRVADQHGAVVAGEKENSVFQIGHDLVEVLFQRRENLFHVAHAAAEALDLVRYLHHGIAR